MSQRSARAIILFGVVLASATTARAQQTTYHLHKEPTDNFFYCGYSLKADPNGGPDAPTFAIQSDDLKNKPTGTVGGFACFEMATIPTNWGGTIPPSSPVTFRVWMKKTADWGVIHPWAVLNLASGSDPGIQLCASAGADTLSKVFPQNVFTFSCTTPATPTTVTNTQKLRLWVGYSISTTPGNHSVKAELDIETGFDSQMDAPNPLPPTITSINPTSGPVNWPVSISGTRLGTSGTVKFGTVAATPTSWTDTLIVAPAPATLAVGSTPPVTVTVGGVVSSCRTCRNSCRFLTRK